MWTANVLFLFIFLYSTRTSRGLPDYGDQKFFDAPMSFTVESTVLLNDMNRRDKEVSYKLNGTLQLVPLGRDSGTGRPLIKFAVLHPYLLGRGTHVNAEYMPLPSFWDSYSESHFYVHDNNGTFNEIYVDPSEPEEIINFKRSLLSLFQFNYTLEFGNETDFSGTCEVQYEVMSDQVIRKVKRRCSGDTPGAASRRVARYSLDAHGPQEVYAEEVHELHAALKARAWLRLRRTHAPGPAPVAAPSAAAAVPAALAALPLAVPVVEEDDGESPNVEELEELVSQAGRLARGAAAGGAAAAALQLLPALRAAAPPALAALLDRSAAAGNLPLAEACGALGAAGSAAALAAVRARLAGPRAAHLAQRYYEGLALAHRPDEAVVMEALRAGEAGGAAAGGALLAAAAAGTRLPPAAAAAVRARLLRALELCQEVECTVRCLRALGNMRHADDTDLLLRHASGGAGPAARAAVGALAAGPAPALYNATRLWRLERAALGGGSPAERAAALELLVTRGARAPASLLPLLLALPEHAPPELRHLAWGRLASLAGRDAGLRMMLAALPARDGGWAARSHPGRSAAVERAAGGGGGWRAALRASLLERAGAVRRAELALAATAPDDTSEDVLTLELWMPDGAGAAELLPTVGGVLLRPRSLRANHTVLSVLQLTRDENDARALLGGGLLRLRRRAARAVALRPKEAGRLDARGAAAAQVEARVAGAWGELSASALSWVTPRARLLLVAGGCACADVAPLQVGSEVDLNSALGAARRRVRRLRGSHLPAPGRTLSLADPLRAPCLDLNE